MTLRTCLAMPVPEVHIEVMMRELDLTEWERGEWRCLIFGADHE